MCTGQIFCFPAGLHVIRYQRGEMVFFSTMYECFLVNRFFFRSLTHITIRHSTLLARVVARNYYYHSFHPSCQQSSACGRDSIFLSALLTTPGASSLCPKREVSLQLDSTVPGKEKEKQKQHSTNDQLWCKPPLAFWCTRGEPACEQYSLFMI